MASHGVVKTNWYKIKAILAVVALLALAFAFACDNGGGPERDSITPVTKVVRVVEWPDGWPVPPLPVMSLEHESGVTQGSPHRYCWQLEDAADRVCKEYNIWSGVSHYPEVVPSERIPIIIDADTRPTKMFAQVYTRPGNLMVGGLRRLTTGAPWLDLADVGPGVYNVRLIGYWQDNEISYEFGLSVHGVVEMKGGCDMTAIDVAPVLTLESPDDRKRTAPDDANRAGCRFNKTIIRVSMTLHNDDLGPTRRLSTSTRRRPRSDFRFGTAWPRKRPGSRCRPVSTHAGWSRSRRTGRSGSLRLAGSSRPSTWPSAEPGFRGALWTLAARAALP